MKKYPVRCPITSYLSIVEGHWKPIIIWHIREKPLRFKDLIELMPDISTKVLTDQLKELESDAIIQRQQFKELPPRVEYALTDYGHTLLPVIALAREWGLTHLQRNPTILHESSGWQAASHLSNPSPNP
jgi:DNA-binding HxlR family transcriptional regulator